MKLFASGNNNYNNTIERDVGIITTVLKSGNSVELPAKGYSMFPTFLPGSRVIIKPLASETLPVPGSVVVFQNNNALVMHRMTEITRDNNGNQIFITCGDSMIEPDKPLIRQQILGIAVICKSAKREYPVRTYLPRPYQYKLNRRLLWIYYKILKLRVKLGLRDTTIVF
jgi:signal peptidase I